MADTSREDVASPELASGHPSRPSRPQSVAALLRSPGASLRTLRKKLSSTGLSVRSPKASPGRGEGTGLNVSHVGGGDQVAALSSEQRTFSPLSVVTGGPFHFDVKRALETAEKTSLSPTIGDATTASQDPVKREFSPPSTPTTMKPRREDDELTIKPAKSFTMSSSNSPSSSPPETNASSQIRIPKQRVITGDIRDLARLPPPDLSQHPAFQENPFTSTSDAPLLVTETKSEEIKRLVKEARRRFDEKERQMEREEAEQEAAERQGKVTFGQLPVRGNAFAADNHRGTPVEAKPFNMAGTMASNSVAAGPSDRKRAASQQTSRQTPDPTLTRKLRNKASRPQIERDNEETDIYAILNDSSPPYAKTPSQAKNSIDSSKSVGTPISEVSEQKKTGLRKMTGIFKQPKPEKEASSPTTASSTGSDLLHRPNLEGYLRRSTNNHTYDYDPGQPYPRHPNTSRAWHSRNLKCTNCQDQCCAVCGRACCAYKAAALALEIHKDNPESLQVAEERLIQIAYLFPYGQEAPTFLQCTKYEEIGCGKMVCPDCCGECPNPICKDIQCRKCKKNPWSECMWHDDDMNRLAL